MRYQTRFTQTTEFSLRPFFTSWILGLVNYNDLGYSHRGDFEATQVAYFGNAYSLKWPEKKTNELQIGNVLFTKAGAQLASICATDPIPGFEDYTVKKWSELNIEVKPLQSQTTWPEIKIDVKPMQPQTQTWL